MKRIGLAGLAVAATLSTLPALAQYYGNPYDGRSGVAREYDGPESVPQPRYDRPAPDRYDRDDRSGYGRGYDRAERGYERREREYDRGERGYDRRGYSERQSPQRTQYGSLCVTARGSCSTGRALPQNTPCGCNIDGFGYKRGAVAGGAYGY